jgi:c-di-GMP-related signal transduction protein
MFPGETPIRLTGGFGSADFPLMELFVARQPILDQHLKTVAFELLFRSGPAGTSYDGSDGEVATARVISTVFQAPGGIDILGGKPGFINFPRGLLVDGGAMVVPPDQAVIEILESVEPDSEVVEACQRLRSAHYRLALDDVIADSPSHALAPLVHYVKVDFRCTSPDEQALIARRYLGHAELIAEKVETIEEFERGVEAGYSLFQGYFFARPVTMASRDIAGFKLGYLQILQELHSDELDLDHIDQLLRNCPSLVYKLLLFVNSALFSTRKRISSVRQAMLMIGEDGIRRWLTVALLVDLSTDQPDELMVNALIRARFAELLAPEARLGAFGGDLFLIGLFSRLDAMYRRPLAELLDGLSLRTEILETLLGTAPPGDRIALLWELVCAHEAADWDKVTQGVTDLGMRPVAIPALYNAAVTWADGVFWR